MKLEEIKKVIEKFKNYSLDEFELIRSFESIQNDITETHLYHYRELMSNVICDLEILYFTTEDDAKRRSFLEKIKELEDQLKIS